MQPDDICKLAYPEAKRRILKGAKLRTFERLYGPIDLIEVEIAQIRLAELERQKGAGPKPHPL